MHDSAENKFLASAREEKEESPSQQIDDTKSNQEPVPNPNGHEDFFVDHVGNQDALLSVLLNVGLKSADLKMMFKVN